jgi:hypothetical protein
VAYGNHNLIFSGKERRVQSAALTLEVSGRPQVMLTNSTRTQEFVQNRDAAVKAVFCSDPKYRKVFWDWGSLNLTEGNIDCRFLFDSFRNHLICVL